MNNKTPITLDEIDYTLCHLPENKRWEIKRFFDSDTDKKKRVDYVKRLLGHGGGDIHNMPGSEYTEWDGWLSKGFIIRRRRKGETSAELRLTWTQVTNRIIQLISSGDFTENESRP